MPPYGVKCHQKAKYYILRLAISRIRAQGVALLRGGNVFIGLKLGGKLENAIKKREVEGFSRTQICKAALWQYLRLDGGIE